MTKLKRLAVLAIASAISFSGGKFLTEPRVEIREVEKVVYKERTDYARDVNRRETIRPDGTRIIEHESSTKRRTDTEAETEKKSSKVTESRPDWRATLTYEPMIPAMQDPVYRVTIERRIISELYAGISVSNERTVGITIGIGF